MIDVTRGGENEILFVHRTDLEIVRTMSDEKFVILSVAKNLANVRGTFVWSLPRILRGMTKYLLWPQRSTKCCKQLLILRMKNCSQIEHERFLCHIPDNCGTAVTQTLRDFVG